MPSHYLTIITVFFAVVVTNLLYHDHGDTGYHYVLYHNTYQGITGCTTLSVTIWSKYCSCLVYIHMLSEAYATDTMQSTKLKFYFLELV